MTVLRARSGGPARLSANSGSGANLMLILEVASTLLIAASVWSKVSFALTLLRLPMGWLKVFVWYLIISVTTVIGAAGLFLWISCTTTGGQRNAGFCLSPDILTPYLVFSGGTFLPTSAGSWSAALTFSTAYAALVDITLAMLPWKVLWGLEVKTGEKIGVALAMSMGVLYASTSDAPEITADRKTPSSAGIASIVKTTKYPLVKAGDPCK